MADGDIKIKDLSAALQIDDSAEFVYTQDNGGTNTTFKAPVNQIARKVAEGITYTNLETTAKTLVGAINELKSLGSPILLGTSAPTSQQGANGNLYVQYTEGTGGADDEVDAIFVKIGGAWCEISTGGGGSGGHTIVNDSGTSLTQRTNLQFKGAYSEDNATDDTTEIDVVREMTKAEFDELTEAEKTGLINVTDEHDSANKNYSETTLWSGSETPSTSGTDITLTDDIANYDEIVFYVISESGRKSQESFFVSGLSIGETYLEETYPPESIGVFWVYTSGTSIKIYRISSSSGNAITYTKVLGIKYGNGTKTFHNYSTAEQVVGTWIDGSTLYEKTLNVGTISTSTTVAHGITNLDKIICYECLGDYVNTPSIFPWQNPASSYGFGINTYDSTDITFARSSGLGSNFSNCYCTIRYTKSV